MVSFSQLQAVRKDTIFGGIQTKLGPSYFVRALEITLVSCLSQQPTYNGRDTIHLDIKQFCLDVK
jgi:hypothetical protein